MAPISRVTRPSVSVSGISRIWNETVLPSSVAPRALKRFLPDIFLLERLDRAVFEGGPLGDKVAGVGGKDGMGHGKDGKHGKHGKHGKPKPETIEVVRYIPYRYTRTVVAPRRQTTVVVMERVETHDLGRIEVTLRPRSETVSAVCLDFKGNEYPALAVKPDGAGPGYAGEIFRCEGERMLRVSYPTGATSILGSVRTADGTSYKDCDAGDALVRTADGDLRCAPKRPMSPGMERALASPASAVPTRDMRARAAAGTLRILRIVGITGSCGARLDAGPSIVEPLMDRPR